MKPACIVYGTWKPYTMQEVSLRAGKRGAGKKLGSLHIWSMRNAPHDKFIHLALELEAEKLGYEIVRIKTQNWEKEL